ncbi:hypothetical protein K3495_g12281 [Podosphaera aphanis]|nr:hypothetical protein K3495_g12281 [Podosphaera aphanis]
MYIRNRLPTTALPFGPENSRAGSNIMPVSAFSDKAATLKKLRVFGCSAYPLSFRETKTASSKVAPNIETDWIFIGIQSNTIWILLNRKTGKEQRTTDCELKEHMFPGMMAQGNVTEPKLTQTSESLHKIRKPDNVQKVVDSNPHSNRVSRDSGCKSQEQIDSNKVLESLSSREKSDQKSSKFDKDTTSGKQLHMNVEKSNLIPNNTNMQIITRSGKVAGLNVDKNAKGFAFKTALSAKTLNALLIEHREEPTSLGVPAVPFESLTLKQAFSEDKSAWEASLLDELMSLEKNNSFEIIEGDHSTGNGRKLISSRWVLMNKFNADGSIARKKARIVGKGYEKQYGIDYFETFATVIRYATLRAIFSYAAIHDFELDHLDIDTAFLNPTLKEPNFLRIPEYFHLLKPWIRGVEHKYHLKLNEALYGLKQSPPEWFIEVRRFFNEIWFTPGDSNPNLFISSPMGEKRERVYILLFVDYLLIAGRRSLVDELKFKIMKNWRCKNLGLVEIFVDFQVKRNRASCSLTTYQEFYVKKLLELLGMKNCNGVTTPLTPGTVLKENEDDELLCDDNAALYRQIVGSTIYLSNGTGPDISYAVGQLARFMAKPKLTHLSHAKHLLRYLQRTAEYGIAYSTDHGNTYTANLKSNMFDIYTGATWGTEDDRKSIQGFTVIYNGGVISWTSQRQKSTALNSMEAAIIATNEGAKEAAWTEKLWQDLHQTRFIPTLWCDN